MSLPDGAHATRNEGLILADMVRLFLHTRRWSVLTVAAILAGLLLRCVGLERDVVDFVLPEHGDAAEHLYRFHPDEHSVVDGALRYDDPFDPPFTMYGTLPLHALRLVLWLGGGEGDADTPYRVGRWLSVLFSTLTLAATWWLARPVVGDPAASLATGLLAVAPLAVQQAHFYTVDSAFALFCTAALAASLRLLERDRTRDALLAGLLIGLAACVRLNGALLGLVLALALVLREGSALRALRHPQLWVAGLAAVGVMILLQPFLLTSPQLLWQARHPLDFGQIIRVVSGAELQLYTLQYLAATPLLYQATHLLPLAVGGAVTAAVGGGLLRALALRDRRRLVLLAWIALYLLTAASALVKPARYLLPLLPPLLVLAADLCVWLASRPGGDRWRWPPRALAMLVVLHGLLYGAAYLRVWTTEDSRIQAGRWIAEHVPAGETLLMERGAFTMGPVVSAQRHPVRALSLSTLFEARGYLPCSTTAAWLERDIAGAPWMTLVEENRALHVASAPDVLPVVSSFYEHLLDGRLGYQTVQRIKVTPSFAGITFPDDGAESTWLGFDHPTARVLRRGPEAATAWSLWTEGLDREPFCADRTLRAGATALRAGDAPAALALFEEAQSSTTSGDLARILTAIARVRAGQPSTGEVLELNDLTPLGLAELGLPADSERLVRLLAERETADPCLRARKFLVTAEALRQRDAVMAYRTVEAIARHLCDEL